MTKQHTTLVPFAPKNVTKKNNAALTPQQKILEAGLIKPVMLLDLGDGAFTDSSVKMKPHKHVEGGFVLKCVNKARLMKALKKAGLDAKVFKGGKHWIADPFASPQAMLAAPSKAKGLLKG